MPFFARSILSLCLAAACVEAFAASSSTLLPATQPVSQLATQPFSVDPALIRPKRQDVTEVPTRPATGRVVSTIVPKAVPGLSSRPSAASDLPLKVSHGLSGSAPVGKNLTGPTFLEADEMKGRADHHLEATGKVRMQNLREYVQADWLHYDQLADEVSAKGDVVFMREQDRIEASELKLKLTDRIGEMKTVRFIFAHSTKPPKEDDEPVFAAPSLLVAQGESKILRFLGKDKYQMDDASYTTCPLDEADWVMKMDELKLDYLSSLGSARQVRVEFMNTPILYAPWIDFSLDNRRKSGFLAPTYGASTERGLELMTPWYWNIAPNRDATITPRVMTRRGVQVSGEYRYLQSSYKGELIAEYLPTDQVANRDRYLTIWKHAQRFNANLAGKIDIQSVSDDNYFVDLSNQINLTSKVHLPRQGELLYDIGWLQAKGLVQTHQTLQEPTAPVIFEPYTRLPQLNLDLQSNQLIGNQLDIGLTGEFVSFNRRLDVGPQQGVEGRRLHLNPSVSYSLQTPYATVTPKLGWLFTRYDLDDSTAVQRDSMNRTTLANPLGTIAMPLGGFANTTRSMPVFSLDTGLVLERDENYFGRGFIQTLEPRLYYLNIPHRKQDTIPVFDSVIGDLSMDRLFSENQYVGLDRINDANQLTFAITSRFLEKDNGKERMAVTLGQRYYLSDQMVTFPGQVPRSSNSTDLLALASGQLTDKLRISSGLQLNTEDNDIVRSNLGLNWRDGPGRVFNADYRYINKDFAAGAGLNQLDLSAQWPLAPKWYGMARLNYSLEDSRLVEGLVGAEYNAGCWSLRGVMQRLATAQNDESNAFFLQLELRGLTKLGPNPLDILTRSISGYAKSDEFDQ